MRVATSTPWQTSDRTWPGKRSNCASAWPQTTAWPGPGGALTLSRLVTPSTFAVVGRHLVQQRQRRRQFRLHLPRRRRRQFRLHRHQVVYPAGRPALLCPLPPQFALSVSISQLMDASMPWVDVALTPRAITSCTHSSITRQPIPG